MQIKLLLMLSMLTVSSYVHSAACSDDDDATCVVEVGEATKAKGTIFFGNALIEHAVVGAGKSSELSHRFFYLELAGAHKLVNAGWNKVDVSGDYPRLLACVFGYLSVQKGHEDLSGQILESLKASECLDVGNPKLTFARKIQEAKRKLWEDRGSDPEILNILKRMTAKPFFACVEYGSPRFTVDGCDGYFWQACPGTHQADATSEVVRREIGPYRSSQIRGYHHWEVVGLNMDVKEWDYVVGPAEVDEAALTMPFVCENKAIVEALKRDETIPEETPVAIVRFNKDALSAAAIVQKLSGFRCRSDSYSFDTYTTT